MGGLAAKNLGTPSCSNDTTNTENEAKESIAKVEDTNEKSKESTVVPVEVNVDTIVPKVDTPIVNEDKTCVSLESKCADDTCESATIISKESIDE